MAVVDLAEFEPPDKPPHTEWAKAEVVVGPEGGSLSTGVLTAPIELATDWTGVLRGFGLDPDVFEIADDTVRLSKWQQSKRTDSGDRDVVWLYSYSARFTRRAPRLAEVDVDKLVRSVLKWKPSIRKDTQLSDSAPCTYLVNLADLQIGKALADDTPVLTPEGWRTHGELRPGDFVYGANGKPVEVLAVTGSREMSGFRVSFDGGPSMVASGEHLWAGYRRYKSWPDNHYARRPLIWTTSQIAEIPKSEVRPGAPFPSRGFHVDMAGAVDFPDIDLPIDPYVLGAWLGDGSKETGYLTVGDRDREHFGDLGHFIPSRKKASNAGTLRVPGLTAALNALSLLYNKHVPDAYLYASESQRLALLQGLMDTDGSATPAGLCEFMNTNRSLSEAVYWLVTSLGMKAGWGEGRAMLYDKDCGPKYRVVFRADIYRQPVFRLARKVARLREVNPDNQTRFRFIQDVEPVGQVSAQCITVEGSLYLAGRDLIVTHNSQGGGVAGAIERIESALEASVQRLAELRKTRNVEHVVIANMGDPIESCEGNYASQLHTVNASLRKQLNIAMAVLIKAIESHDADTFLSTLSNHSEWMRRNGKQVTGDSDSADGYMADQLKMIFEMAGRGPTTWHIPHDEMVTVVELSGVPVGFTHGHKIPSEAKEQGWLQAQAFRLLEEQGAKPRVWVTAHRHHYKAEDFGPWYRFQCPSLDAGSKWYSDLSGQWSTPGMLTMLIGTHDVRGWSDVAVL